MSIKIPIDRALKALGYELDPRERCYQCPVCPQDHRAALKRMDDFRWWCFRCNEGGEAQKLAMVTWGCSWRRAGKRLRAMLGLAKTNSPHYLEDMLKEVEKPVVLLATRQDLLDVVDVFSFECALRVNSHYVRGWLFDPDARWILLRDEVLDERITSLDEVYDRCDALLSDVRKELRRTYLWRQRLQRMNRLHRRSRDS